MNARWENANDAGCVLLSKFFNQVSYPKQDEVLNMQGFLTVLSGRLQRLIFTIDIERLSQE